MRDIYLLVRICGGLYYPIYKNALQTVLNNHILLHKEYLTVNPSDNNGISVAITDVYLSLMSEVQVCGSKFYSIDPLGYGDIKLTIISFRYKCN